MVDWLHISLESAMNHRHKKKKEKVKDLQLQSNTVPVIGGFI